MVREITLVSLARSLARPLFFCLQLATPILSMLDGSPNAWLGSMMQAFNMGDIGAFNKLCSENQEVTFRSD